MMPKRLVAVTRVWLILLLLGVAAGASGQARAGNQRGPRDFDATAFGEQVLLGSEWLFHAGDDAAWAAPGLDDSGWMVVSSERQLAYYGVHDIRHGWYRMHLRVRPGTRGAAIGIRGLRGSYEVFANGVLIGQAGSRSGEIEYTKVALAAYRVPEELISENGQVTLAIRVALSAAGRLGRGTSTPIMDGTEISVTDARAALQEAAYRDIQDIGDSVVLASLCLLVSLVALALFGAMRTRLEYLAAGLALLCSGLEHGVIVWNALEASTFASAVFRYLFLSAGNIALIEFVRIIVKQRRSRELLALEIIAAGTTFFPLAAILGYGPIYFAFASFFLPLILVLVVLTWLLVRGARHGILDARVLLPSVLVLTAIHTFDFFRLLILFAHLQIRPIEIPVLPIGSLRVDVFSISNFLFEITVLLFLVIRTVGIARERQRIAGELEAARTIQLLLLAGDGRETPGFVVESVYYPAAEVGGDFFLVETNAAGSLIAVVGDVSGKGLQAAMRVSMILGVLRREDSWEPRVVLTNLNTALVGTGQSGFTTGCCVTIDREGRGALANAGHISPYLAGDEVATTPALPLGLVAGMAYEQIAFTLGPRQRLVLMSDGVVEARAASGELLGFERVAALAQKGATEIADMAKAFGQDDDITVLTLERKASFLETSS